MLLIVVKDPKKSELIPLTEASLNDKVSTEVTALNGSKSLKLSMPEKLKPKLPPTVVNDLNSEYTLPSKLFGGSKSPVTVCKQLKPLPLSLDAVRAPVPAVTFPSISTKDCNAEMSYREGRLLVNRTSPIIFVIPSKASIPD